VFCRASIRTHKTIQSLFALLQCLSHLHKARKSVVFCCVLVYGHVCLPGNIRNVMAFVTSTCTAHFSFLINFKHPDAKQLSVISRHFCIYSYTEMRTRCFIVFYTMFFTLNKTTGLFPSVLGIRLINIRIYSLGRRAFIQPVVMYRAYTKEWCGFTGDSYLDRTIILCMPCIF
jgi:hypothetical protein